MRLPLPPAPAPQQSPESPTTNIRIQGARTHNLQAVDVEIPLQKLVVVTGVSGSGKSSLVFDTLYRAGQRRFLEHLSPGSRRLIERWERPDVDRIEGLPPTVGVARHSALPRYRSTLGTLTEIYDVLRVLYARSGTAHCPQCGRPVSRQSVGEIVDRILAFPAGTKLMILAPLVRARKGAHDDVLQRIGSAGFVRARIDGTLYDAAETPKLAKTKPHTIEAVVDRIVVKEGIENRLRESIETALRQGEGVCLVSRQQGDQWAESLFSEKFSCADCELDFVELEPRTFSFNSPHGACPACRGLGIESDENANHPCPTCHGSRLAPFGQCVTFDGISLPNLCSMEIDAVVARLELLNSRVSHDVPNSNEAPQCNTLSPLQRRVAQKVLPELLAGLKFLQAVGIGYLTLDRPTPTLSGGELQRAHLAAYLCSEMTDVAYVLDEPTGGLHARDAAQLVELVRRLVEKGNSVLCIEHDESFMRQADYLIDVGPGAGHHGGRIVAQGTPEEVAAQLHSITGRYLAGEALSSLTMEGGSDELPQASLLISGENAPAGGGSASAVSAPRGPENRPFLRLRGATLHNLKNVDLEIPLQALVAVSGVSGCGKSSLILETLVPALRGHLYPGALSGGPFTALEGADQIRGVVEVDQQPLGRTGRSNPASYSGAWDEIRDLFAQTRDARTLGFSPRRFSFNNPGGRCSACHGTGTELIRGILSGNQRTTCRVCRGKRFNLATLAVRYRGKSVADVLAMEIEQAAEFFGNHPRLNSILSSITALGLGYLQLGQSALTLSGGESQRVKLAAALGRREETGLMYVLDEPTTGLHPADVQRLLVLLRQLVEEGRTVVVIEHQLDILAAADWLIDLGPEGGRGGGEIIATGSPRDIAELAKKQDMAVSNATATALLEYYARRASRGRAGGRRASR